MRVRNTIKYTKVLESTFKHIPQTVFKNHLLFFTGKAYITKSKIEKNNPLKGVVFPQYFFLITWQASNLKILKMLAFILKWDWTHQVTFIVPKTISQRNARNYKMVKGNFFLIFSQVLHIDNPSILFHGTTESPRMGVSFNLPHIK